MATTATTSTAQTLATIEPNPSSASTDDQTAKAINKRYEGLMTVRSKAIKGKGAWYWVHLEPMLVPNSETGLPKAVKLRCSLCEAMFSASNPSRTASEHLKRGTCPNFSSSVIPKPISSISPSQISSLGSPSGSNHSNHRKRSSGSGGGVSYNANSLELVDPTQFCPEFSYIASPHLRLSGGKEDLGALEMLENNVKKLKSPKAPPCPALSKSQVDSAINLLAEWVYESCGSVSLSSIENPKFKAFLNQVGLPAISLREIAGARLDTKFEQVKNESEAKIKDAMFFQIASDGWKTKGLGSSYGLVGGEKLVNLTVNLPNGSSVFRKAVFTNGPVSSKYAEEVLWETITSICGGVARQCVGIVADKFKAKALRNLENQNHWMVNISCQVQGFTSLIKDFNKELTLFKTVIENCVRVANFFNTKLQVRNSFLKYQLQQHEHEYTELRMFRVPSNDFENIVSMYAMLEDIWDSAHALQLVVLDESYKVVCAEDPVAVEVGEMIRSAEFWHELEAVRSLVKLVKEMVMEIEAERPLIGRCLPLWEDLRRKVKDWCVQFNVPEGPLEKVIEKRFKKNYHPAWSAAFILDPLYLFKDTSGKYLPPFKYLTPEQEKDVDKLITRLVSREEAHIVLMELMKWRSEGLDPTYAQAVQFKRPDPITGKMKVANPQSSRLVWETSLREFKLLGKVAVRLLFLHATLCGFKSNWSFLRWVCTQGNSRVGMDRAQKMIFIAAHAKLERRDFSSEEDKDTELFAMSNGEDDLLNKVFMDASSV
ncbi:hypothetical protein GIB67_042131 [Kingdonia uniflora]|uniref:DUF7963 domain-containing protein n=1 Tax=Kingdonia uniflora TaxID=39325 RepID=A0A7J7NPC5_9MAGN|nr:hypothetical protein GIB67_042131 [Kingdonia uniflora]